MCMREDSVVIETPVVKDFEITSTGKRKAPSGLTDRELKVFTPNKLTSGWLFKIKEVVNFKTLC